MNKTFQSFVFGCRVNEAERIKIDKELVEAGFSVDLASPAFLIINSCAVTGKAEREAKQLIYQLRKLHPEAQIVLTGCSATVWHKYRTEDSYLADILVPNDKKSSLVSLLLSAVGNNSNHVAFTPRSQPENDKFRHSNRLLVKIQDGCQRFCSYCIVPYLRGMPQSQSVQSIVRYINSFQPLPSEVVLSAINTEAFGIDTGESLIDLIKNVLKHTKVPRIAFGSIHPWTLTDEFLTYYRDELATNPRFVQFFHVPIQSGSQRMLEMMRREYEIKDILKRLNYIQNLSPRAFIATDIIVGYLGETDALFKESYSLLTKSPISRLHVFRFSNRPHTAAYYLTKKIKEPSMDSKKDRSNRLIALSKKKYEVFLNSQIGTDCSALIIGKHKNGTRVLLNNHIEGVLLAKQCLPGELVHVTIIAAKDGLVVCKES